MSLPERLGKYRVTDVLGQGAMGIVYKGFDPDIRREVALKTLRGNTAHGVGPGDGVSNGDRFRNEAQAAGRLQHPGIVAVYDYGHEAGLDFIAMEYVRGDTLARYMAQAAAGQLHIGDDDVLSIIGQLLEALHHAHQQGVWHRDIKPSNLIMTRDGRIKITDFGIARIESAGLTQAASLIGTPMYMAPEQFKGQAIDRRVDLYAAGVVLYQLLAGHPPFSGTPEALMFKAVHEAPVPLSQLPDKGHLAAYDGLLARALAKAPDDRFADALQFRDALSAVVGRRHNHTVSEATITALLPLPAGASGGPGGRDRGTTSGLPPTHFDPALLAQVEAALARHVGPLARVLVRRAARDSVDLPALMAKLADQVADTTARQAFLRQGALLAGHHPATGGSQGAMTGAAGLRSAVAAPGTVRPAGSAGGTGVAGVAGGAASPGQAPGAGSAVSGGSASTGRAAAAPAAADAGLASAADAPASAALQDAARQLLAQRLGPIAAVLVRRAAAAAPQRAAFISRLAESVDDPAVRQALLDALRQRRD